ncbi:hypothetical protein ACJJTC_004577 [Scirpophaga incertulas]
MQVFGEWAQVEVVELVNDGSGLAFGIVGGRSSGVLVKSVLPGGVADRAFKTSPVLVSEQIEVCRASPIVWHLGFRQQLTAARGRRKCFAPIRLTYDLLQLIMMGKVAGKRRVGGRKKSWLRNIRQWTGIAKAAHLFRLARRREDWTKLIADLH